MTLITEEEANKAQAVVSAYYEQEKKRHDDPNGDYCMYCKGPCERKGVDIYDEDEN